MGRMHVLNRAGDSELSWTPGDPKTEEMARAVFGRLKGMGLTPVSLDENKRASRINDFDPAAEEIIFLRRGAGG